MSENLYFQQQFVATHIDEMQFFQRIISVCPLNVPNLCSKSLPVTLDRHTIYTSRISF